MAVKFSNNAKTALSSGITSSATSITVADGSVFPSISGSDYFYVTLEVDSDSDLKEIVKCTARNGNTLTITRGQDGTSARTFSSGDKCELRLNAAALNDAVVGNNTTEMLLNQFTGDGSTTAFTLSNSPDENLTNVFLSGVYQSKSNYSISGSSLTFSTAPPNGLPIEVMVAKSVEISIATPADDSVTTAKIADDAVTSDKLSNALSTKIAGIETSADVTDTANVVAALSAGTGVSISAGGEIANTSPDQTVALTGAGSASVSGTYPNFTISSTDTDTTYSVGDGGLTEVNFTSADNTKLDAINQGVATTDSPTFSNMTLNGTDAILVSVGTTAQRPTGTAGQLRYNSTTGEFEGYTTEWGSIGGGIGAEYISATPTLSSPSDNKIVIGNYSSYSNPTFALFLGTTPLTFSQDGATLTILDYTTTGNQTVTVRAAHGGGSIFSTVATVSVNIISPAARYWRLTGFITVNTLGVRVGHFLPYTDYNAQGTFPTSNSQYSASRVASGYYASSPRNTNLSVPWTVSSPKMQTYDWLKVDMQSDVIINSFRIGFGNHATYYGSARLILEKSTDDSTWSQVAIFGGSNYGGVSGSGTTLVSARNAIQTFNRTNEWAL